MNARRPRVDQDFLKLTLELRDFNLHFDQIVSNVKQS